MKYIKKFEFFDKIKNLLNKKPIVEPIKKEPQIDDYVLVKFYNPTILGEKMMNTIGRIRGKDKYGYHIYYKFDDEKLARPSDIYYLSFSNNLNSIEYFSPDKEEVEAFINSKKYNL